jgi:hypothetical protein
MNTSLTGISTESMRRTIQFLIACPYFLVSFKHVAINVSIWLAAYMASMWRMFCPWCNAGYFRKIGCLWNIFPDTFVCFPYSPFQLHCFLSFIWCWCGRIRVFLRSAGCMGVDSSFMRCTACFEFFPELEASRAVDGLCRSVHAVLGGATLPNKLYTRIIVLFEWLNLN